MKAAFLVVGALWATVACSAAEAILLARFTVTEKAFSARPAKPPAVTFYRSGEDVQVEGVGDIPGRVSIGGLESARLLASLAAIKLPRIDYQKHFDQLRSSKPVRGKGPARRGHGWLTTDGYEVQVVMRIGDSGVSFRIWNPEAFFFSYNDDPAVSAVSSAVDAFVLAVSRGRLFR